MAGVFRIILAVVAISISLGAPGGPGPTSSATAVCRTPLSCTKAPGAIHNDLDRAQHALITRVCHTDARSWSAGRARGFGLVPVPLFVEFDDRSGTPRASIVYQLGSSSRVVQLSAYAAGASLVVVL
ncbi:hypothetical protein ACVGVM_16270 [Pseudonocardia bannensis]|uniref:Uncharacterized protein n=1 Tax=Pseudonocardia bannensis TaxID=630973 RepID=A0A848DLI7_9PSEU|nr:hypothetical protein [Pseudonocardia bannensis]NMH93254.1 hypothetical protein [Pseudonocardia bannensis]